MKALILAAGFGTRLLPHTARLPKPLFPLAGRPLIDHLIEQLKKSGATEIMINTHHLHEMVEAHVARSSFNVPVHTRFEPVILETGGAVKNLADFWDNDPFLVINCDIITDIDLKEVYEFHRTHTHLATLVMHDHERFNTVFVDDRGFIRGFSGHPSGDRVTMDLSLRRMAFTGIHVMEPAVLDFIPEKTSVGIVEIYERMIQEGRPPMAFPITGRYWIDIGSKESYRQAVFDRMAKPAFERQLGGKAGLEITVEPLKGDGSDRVWRRLKSGDRSLILVDHGIRNGEGTVEADAFIAIGTHLREKGVPVPEIVAHDAFSGLVFLEDLGDTHFETHIRQLKNQEDAASALRRVIDIIIHMNQRGGEGFRDNFTWQTSCYDKALILEKECRYFVEAFLNGYLGLHIPFSHFADEFDLLAEKALQKGIVGFMHRDMQSRNIMVKEGRFYLIDFQGGRRGPLQYDIASLINDPYMNLPFPVRRSLSEYAALQTLKKTGVSVDHFMEGYGYLSLTRSLQILGAFGFLSKVKGKSWFESHIPAALSSLRKILAAMEEPRFPKLIRSLGKAT